MRDNFLSPRACLRGAASAKAGERIEVRGLSKPVKNLTLTLPSPIKGEEKAGVI